ncbi:type VI secretion system tube protein TssD [Flavobacterium columnare]|uniref:type VI secretion system tube protein TssD n=1 Tax=Flavobacterium columnare TaxID=996 RepID=UPI000D1BC795|nr:type VI secretion system tube protein TssD [Flavobacterium columnare]MBF6654952.1 phage tail protein [Flavobacterium columnare]MBF6658746.1 phage tail protein [Flavobacterium columnare]PTD13887.1 phage tail protein [Flavobacterium columnare]PTD14882.1 phage tail protein [Flavobacterium columnare]
MSFKAKLAVAGKEYTVLNVNYGLFQETDATGRPSTVTRGGKIELTIEGTSDTSFFEWMTNSFERKDGSVKFFKRDSEAVLKELKFSEGYLVKFRENFDSTGVNPLTETFTISAKKIELGSGAYENEWV